MAVTGSRYAPSTLRVRLERPRQRAVALLVPLLIAFAGIALDDPWGGHDSLYWRRAALPVALIFWVLLRQPAVNRRSQRAEAGLMTLRPAGSPPLAVQPTRVREELLAAAGGVLIGLAVTQPWRDTATGGISHWTSIFLVLIFFALAVTLIYSMRKFSVSLRRDLNGELDIDPFDMSPFQAIANWALSITVSSLGAVTLVITLYPDPLLQFPGILIFPAGIAGAVGLFVATLHQTHRRMAAAKREELTLIRRRLTERHRALKSDANPDSELTADFATWLSLERRMQDVPDWPYTIQTLRTLALYVLTPVAIAAFQLYIKK